MLALDRVEGTHNGGHLEFGPDGYLYVAFGDGRAGDPENNAQSLHSLFGKMLRLDVSARPYAVPPDNPFVGRDALPEIYALGFRNPWSWSFDHPTKELWLGDVGHLLWEEVDVSVQTNFGWRALRGAHCFRPPSARKMGSSACSQYSRPDGGAVIGGRVYRGRAIPALRGGTSRGLRARTVWALSSQAAARRRGGSPRRG